MRNIFLVLPLFLSLLTSPRSVLASVLSEAAASLQAGEWVKLGTYPDLVTATADNDGWRTFEYSFRLFWVRAGALGTGKLVHLGSGHSSGEWHLVEYDEATNSWSRDPRANLSCHIHSYGQYTVNTSTGEMYAICLPETNDTFQRWNGSAWTVLKPWPGGYPTLMSSAYFPETGNIWVANGYGGDGLYAYDPQQNEWIAKNGNFVIGQNLDMVYLPHHQKVVFGGGDGGRNIYVIDKNGEVTTSNSTTPYNWRVKVALADYDAGSGDLLLFFSQDNSIRQFNPTTDQLLNLGRFDAYPPFTMKSSSEEVWGHGVILATIPDYGVILIAEDSTGEVWLYKHAPFTGGTTSPSPPSNLEVH